MAAAPVHYIRTIHTSFTAAHPHSSSAWAASHASSATMSRVHTHSNILQNMSLNYNTSTAPVVSKYPPGLGAPPPMGRKRSASIRVAPPAYAAQRIQRVKFDPFAEDSESTTIASNHNTLVSSSVLYNSAYQQHHHAAPANTRPASSMPYTIQIPPAAPADIQRHHQQQLQYRQQRQQATPPQTQPVQQRVVVPTPPRPSQIQTRTATTATTVATANREREARSKIVAGILLNRVHAVGKPMRRRVTEQHQPRPYVPSGLSSCISIEA